MLYNIYEYSQPSLYLLSFYYFTQIGMQQNIYLPSIYCILYLYFLPCTLLHTNHHFQRTYNSFSWIDFSHFSSISKINYTVDNHTTSNIIIYYQILVKINVASKWLSIIYRLRNVIYPLAKGYIPKLSNIIYIHCGQLN